MRHFARFGLPSLSYLIVEIAIVRREAPRVGYSFQYSDSFIVVHVGRFANPSYSLLYAWFHVFWSSLVREFILRSVGISRDCRLAAVTWEATNEWSLDRRRVLYIVWKGGWPRNSWNVEIK